MARNHEFDEDTRALIEQLCTRAGMLMEDASVEVLFRATSIAHLRFKMERTRRAVKQMHQLLDAVEALAQSACCATTLESNGGRQQQ